ncbi:MAG: hypothetical protein D6771_04755, partial [Zetaproteobacteria bacterium]
MSNQRGYILATSLLLLAVLSVLGAVASYKAIIGTRMAKISGDVARAEQVTEAALNQIFWYWTQSGITEPDCTYKTGPLAGSVDPGCQERTAITDYVLDPYGAAPFPFVADLYGESLQDLIASPAVGGASMADLDNYLATSGKVRVYTLVNSGGAVQIVDAYAWGAVRAPQAAVWVTSYQWSGDPSEYPYLDPYGNEKVGCFGSGCMIVVYALGRDGEARALVREAQGWFSKQLRGVTAITNAPPYSTWMDFCHRQNATAVGASLSWDPAKQTGDFAVEATQAPYALGSAPSGTALSSNTNMGIGGKGFRKDVNSTSELTADSTPLIAYATHGAQKHLHAKWASDPMDTAVLDDPFHSSPSVLPYRILRPGLAATPDKLNYFDVSADGQLFELDAYRWAAEQFICQHVRPDPTGPLNAIAADTGTSTDPYANGAFCERAVRLQKKIMQLYPLDPADPYFAQASDPAIPLAEKVNKYWPRITGRLTVEDFWRNIRDGRPMFGFVRVMYPTKAFMDTGEFCETAGGRRVYLYDAVTTLNQIKVGSVHTFKHPSGRSIKVTVGGKAKLIVYGMLLMDYFTDGAYFY